MYYGGIAVRIPGKTSVCVGVCVCVCVCVEMEGGAQIVEAFSGAEPWWLQRHR